MSMKIVFGAFVDTFGKLCHTIRKKICRNAPCPCGSGKKYKNCHGRLEGAANKHLPKLKLSGISFGPAQFLFFVG